MNTSKLKKLFEASTDKYGDARKMGVTYVTLTNIISNKVDIRVSTLEKISKYYKVPVGYFFDEATADGQKSHEAQINRLKGQIEGLKEALKLLKKE